MREEFLWVEKYRPRKLEDAILPENLRSKFASYIQAGDVPNLLFVGKPGIGKTTVARILADGVEADCLVVNASLEGGIDTLREKIKRYATSVSVANPGKRKIIVLDEADRLSQAMQQGLRGFMEEFSRNCGFILTANYRANIIDALQSRCPAMEFVISKDERQALAAKYWELCADILRKEGVSFDSNALAETVRKWFPDFRKIIASLQQMVTTDLGGGKTLGEQAGFDNLDLDKLEASMRAKSFEECRKWVARNVDIDQNFVIRSIYDHLRTRLDDESTALMAQVAAEYMYRIPFCADQEINTGAFVTQVWAQCKWK